MLDGRYTRPILHEQLLMKFYLTLSLLACLLWACGEEESASSKNPPGAPAWTAGYPAVAQGAVSVDLNLQADRSVKVYWVITNQKVSFTAADLKKQAVTPKNTAIKFSGTTDAPSGQETRKTVTKLAENTKYFAYLIAQNIQDTISQVDVKEIEFTTYIRQDEGEYTSAAESRKVKYLIYRPEEVLKYPKESYPILFFLGGNGEVADPGEINMIRNGSLPEFISLGNNVPMMVFSIQHTVLNWNVNLIDEGVVYALKTYPVDSKRVYMTGISGGGFGCWNYATNFSTKLAAIVPISGGGNTSKACNLKTMDIWAFHNLTDNTVDVSNSKNMINAVNACPSNKEVKLLIFPDKGHDCWRRVYNKNHANWSKSPDTPKPDIYTWLLSKSK